MFRGYKNSAGQVVMDKEYLDHAIFKTLGEASKFYYRLSDNVVCFVHRRVSACPIINYDSYFFEALANSILSIKMILELGHVTDAKVLLRNVFDGMIVNLYFMARLKKKDADFVSSMSDENFLIHGLKLGQFYDANVSDWLANNKTKGLKKTLRYEDMLKFLKQETRIAGIVDYLDSSECKNIREWLNDAVHLNYYKAILLNNGRPCVDRERKSAIDEFKHAFDWISMFHITCMFCLEPIYMMSSDYTDYVNCGMHPPEGCENDVEPFIQSYLDDTIYNKAPSWVEKLISAVDPMRLRKL